MKLQAIDQASGKEGGQEIQVIRDNGAKFAPLLEQELLLAADKKAVDRPGFYFYLNREAPSLPAKTSMQTALSAYQANAPTPKPLSGLQKYIDDQLLSNPGGDRYNLDAREMKPAGSSSFAQRLSKDVADAFGNVRNFFADFFLGSKFCYRDEQGEIKEGRKRGVLAAVGDFFKDLGSFLSFGTWRPDGEAEPKGFRERLKFSFLKLKEAVVDDLLKGVPAGVNHMAEDTLLAAWNVAETVPDATIGNFTSGEKMTSKVFDGGQVMIDYITDVIPTGEGWQRVHAWSLKKWKPPILHNIQKPERDLEDSRWRFIRNTPFRKTIETIGSLAADVLTFGLFRWVTSSGSKPRQEP